MSKVCVAAVLLTLAVLLPQPQVAEAQSWSDLVPALTNIIKAAWRNTDFQFMGSKCRYEQKPKIKRWQLYYKGKFYCPDWVNVVGRSETRSFSGVMVAAIRDFLNKAHAQGAISEEDARVWLEGYSS